MEVEFETAPGLNPFTKGLPLRNLLQVGLMTHSVRSFIESV